MSMPLDLLRSTPQHETTFWSAKQSFCLLGLASTALLVRLDVHLFGHPLLYALQLCADLRCYLLRRYIFIAVIVMVLVILNLTDKEGGAPGEVSPDVWFDAAQSPTFRDVATENSESTPVSSLKPADSSPGGSGSDDFSPTTGFESPASSPVVVVAVGGIKPSEKAPAPLVEEEDDSMDATWKAITGKAPASAPHMKKNNTWDVRPSVQVGPEARVELRRSETFQEEAAVAAARRTVLERRIDGREVEMAEDHDEMNRRFEAFINKFNSQLRLQRLASLRRRHYMGIVYSADTS